MLQQWAAHTFTEILIMMGFNNLETVQDDLIELLKSRGYKSRHLMFMALYVILWTLQESMGESQGVIQ